MARGQQPPNYHCCALAAAEVPWHTFLIASSVLVAVWIVGIVWYVINPLAMSMSQIEGREGMRSSDGIQ